MWSLQTFPWTWSISVPAISRSAFIGPFPSKPRRVFDLTGKSAWCRCSQGHTGACEPGTALASAPRAITAFVTMQLCNHVTLFHASRITFHVLSLSDFLACEPTGNRAYNRTAVRSHNHNHMNGQSNHALVNVDGVEKMFHRGSEDIHVLADLHLKVPKGEFLALMGPSGSGKSTLLNLIGGLDRPTKGTVSIDGERVDELSDRKLAAWRARHIGFVFQLYNLLPVLTAERNVELPLLLTHLSKAERNKHVAAALAIVGLSQRAKLFPRTLSGGEQQRVGIARGIVTDPTLLLCDEPTGDLDRKSGDEILDLLQALNREHNKTIIMVTHDPHASARASRTVYLNKGQLSNEPVK